MFDMFYRKKREESESDNKLSKIAELLFPQLQVVDTFAVDSSVDTNLEAVLQDLRDGYLDEISISTLEKILKKIGEVRDLMQVNHRLLGKVDRYILAIEPGQYDLDPESIKPAEDGE